MACLKKIAISICLITIFQSSAFSQSALDNCAAQFIGDSIDNAPTIQNSPSGKPFGANQHLCYRDDGVSFFALEFQPEAFAPRWAAYKLSPKNYGGSGKTNSVSVFKENKHQ